MKLSLLLIGAAASTSVVASGRQPISPRGSYQPWWKQTSPPPGSYPGAGAGSSRPSRGFESCPTWQFGAPPVQLAPTGDGHCCLPGRDKDSLNCCRTFLTPMLSGWWELSCDNEMWYTVEKYKRFRGCNTGTIKPRVCARKGIILDAKLVSKYKPRRPENLNPDPRRERKDSEDTPFDQNVEGMGHRTKAYEAVVKADQGLRKKPSRSYKTPDSSRLGPRNNINPDPEPLASQSHKV
ncbi:hypothetical protein MGG_08946 [Pyricularia oryzae 70-15]|uniref:Uncharacterized protein n=1 Tax=Pyricularia oryzae (strain 70-15 / ATCC MYA-4617 / FGSC 8958) TaxID=242507 RepID=G4MW23_PYRO7|nr:uncharacterized protein MGG_08946 [Pyricularia oryzae 70-15]EHA54176.1 hypothetical protein MGG_08946 [Pyricularia oryzae 70-15]